MTDIALASGGVLSGQMLDAQGRPVVAERIALRQQNRDVASATTDAQGTFFIDGLRGGVYVISTSTTSGVYRLWAASTEPAGARSSVLIVAGSPIARGQSPGFGWGWVRSPWVLSTTTAAGIATPMVLGNNEPVELWVKPPGSTTPTDPTQPTDPTPPTDNTTPPTTVDDNPEVLSSATEAGIATPPVTPNDAPSAS